MNEKIGVPAYSPEFRKAYDQINRYRDPPDDRRPRQPHSGTPETSFRKKRESENKGDEEYNATWDRLIRESEGTPLEGYVKQFYDGRNDIRNRMDDGRRPDGPKRPVVS